VSVLKNTFSTIGLLFVVSLGQESTDSTVQNLLESDSYKSVVMEITSFTGNQAQLFEKKKKIVILSCRITENLLNANNALLLSLKKDDYWSDISSLNNPTEDIIGIGFQKKVYAIIDKIANRESHSRKSKLIFMANDILTAPLTKKILETVPGGGVVEEIRQLVTTFGISSDKADTIEIKRAKNELRLLFDHYQNLLNELKEYRLATKELTENVESLNSELRKYARKQAKKFDSASSKYPFKDIQFNVYGETNVVSKIQSFENRFTNNGKLKAQQANSNFNYELSNVEMIQLTNYKDKFNIYYNSYIKKSNDFNKNIAKILDNALVNGISKDSSKINSKKTDLASKSGQVISTLNNSINSRLVNEEIED